MKPLKDFPHDCKKPFLCSCEIEELAEKTSNKMMEVVKEHFKKGEGIMEITIKYTVKRLETVIRKSDGVEVTLVKAKTDTDQVIELIDIDLPSFELGDELEVNVKNNGHKTFKKEKE